MVAWFGDFTIESHCAASIRGSNSGSVNTCESDVTIQTADCIDDQTVPIIYAIYIVSHICIGKIAHCVYICSVLFNNY